MKIISRHKSRTYSPTVSDTAVVWDHCSQGRAGSVDLTSRMSLDAQR
jgi:hypothetical protein